MSDAILIKVEGMSCDGCVKSVERAVKLVDPSADVRVDLATGEVRIGSAQAAIADFTGAIAKAGYDVVA